MVANYFLGSAGAAAASPGADFFSSTSFSDALNWSPKFGLVPMNSRAILPSASITTVCGIAVTAYFSAVFPS